MFFFQNIYKKLVNFQNFVSRCKKKTILSFLISFICLQIIIWATCTTRPPRLTSIRTLKARGRPLTWQLKHPHKWVITTWCRSKPVQHRQHLQHQVQTRTSSTITTTTTARKLWWTETTTSTDLPLFRLSLPKKVLVLDTKYSIPPRAKTTTFHYFNREDVNILSIIKTSDVHIFRLIVGFKLILLFLYIKK